MFVSLLRATFCKIILVLHKDIRLFYNIEQFLNGMGISSAAWSSVYRAWFSIFFKVLKFFFFQNVSRPPRKEFETFETSHDIIHFFLFFYFSFKKNWFGKKNLQNIGRIEFLFRNRVIFMFKILFSFVTKQPTLTVLSTLRSTNLSK